MHLFFWALVFTSSLSGCFIDNIFDCIEGDGNLVTQELDISGFDGIKLRTAATLTITQDPEYRVEVTGERNVIRQLDLTVRRGVWYIEFEDCVRRHSRLQIAVTMPEIRELTLSGSGSIEGTNFFDGESIDIFLSGSGYIDLGLAMNSIDAVLSGSGNIKLEGIADDIDHMTSGSGSLKAFDLETRKADIVLSGSGDAEITCMEFLDVRISGSGDVFYKGTPSVDARISGSGQVIDAN